MFLSTRWGVPSFVIEQLPSSEFVKQKRFWQDFKWGMADDLQAMILNQLVSLRLHSKPDKATHHWKDVAATLSGKQVIPQRVSNDSIRAGFMMVCNFIGREENGNDPT